MWHAMVISIDHVFDRPLKLLAEQSEKSGACVVY
jgi:hypothetical protein